MNPTPIKRSKNLIPLSKDHHDGLLVVWKIRQGLRLAIPANRIASFVIHAFDTHLEPHFKEEELLLFSKLMVDDPLLLIAKDQHETLRKLAATLKEEEATISLLETFGNKLEEHIRFEERTLFTEIEKQLSQEVMDAIGIELSRIHSNQKPLHWQDQFWIKN